MNNKFSPKKPDRTNWMRNIIVGSVVWAAAVVIVVFLVLEPSESVQMQIGIELAEQQAVAVLSDSSTDPKSEQTDVATKSPSIELDADSDSQAPAQPEIVESEPKRSSIVFDNDSTDTSASVQTSSTPTATDSVDPLTTEDATRTQTPSTTKPSELALFIQVAAFSKIENAELKQTEISKALFPTRVLKSDDGMNLVLVGPYLTESEAKKVQSELNSKLKLDDSFLKYAEIETNKVAMASSTSSAIIDSVSTATEPVAEESVVEQGWYVRVGSYKNLANAKANKLRVEKLKLSVVVTRETDFNVLLVGPYQDENTAQTAKGRIAQELNIEDAYLVRVGS